MTTTKFYAYYIPKNKPTVMNDYKTQLNEYYGPKITSASFDNNFNANDIEFYASDILNFHHIVDNVQNCLVLTKFTEIKGLFENVQPTKEEQSANAIKRPYQDKNNSDNPNNTFVKIAENLL